MTNHVDVSNEITWETLKSSPSALPFCHPQYQPPSPDEIDAIIRIAGLSQREAANLVGVTSNEKGSPTIRRWKSPVNSKEHRAIPYSSWRLLLEYVGIASTEETRRLLNKKS